MNNFTPKRIIVKQGTIDIPGGSAFALTPQQKKKYLEIMENKK